MKDRNVQYPYRFHVRPVPGTDDICEIIPAPGTIYEDGTFWNKQNVLQDVTAALYGKGAEANPNDIFAYIPTLIETKINLGPKIEIGSYTGNGQHGENNPNSLTFSFIPAFVFMPDFYKSSNVNWIVNQNTLTTSFVRGKGFGWQNTVSGTTYYPYGKKSAGGKTIFWYNTKDEFYQLNESGRIYYYIAIG